MAGACPRSSFSHPICSFQVFTAAPPLAMGLFDKVCSSEARLTYPKLYKPSQNAQYFNFRVRVLCIDTPGGAYRGHFLITLNYSFSGFLGLDFKCSFSLSPSLLATTFGLTARHYLGQRKVRGLLNLGKHSVHGEQHRCPLEVHCQVSLLLFTYYVINFVFQYVIVTVCLKAGLVTSSWTWLTHLAIWGSIGLWFGFIILCR